jgi:DNA-binding transcriptional LysR family regulator
VTAPDFWTFRVGKKDISVPIRSRLVVNTAEAAIDTAVAGLGMTRVLSYQVAAAVRAGKLVLVLRDYEPEPSPVNLVYRSQPLMPLKLRAFIDFAAPRLKAALLQAAI